MQGCNLGPLLGYSCLSLNLGFCESITVLIYSLLFELSESSLVPECYPPQRGGRQQPHHTLNATVQSIIHGGLSTGFQYLKHVSVLQRLFEVVAELESIKPEVQKQVDQINNPYNRISSSSSFLPSDFSSPSQLYARSHSYGNPNDKVGPFLTNRV